MHASRESCIAIGCSQRGCANDCSGHGECDRRSFSCVCAPGWGGPDCGTPLCADGCGAHGTCDAPARCRCADGWGGAHPFPGDDRYDAVQQHGYYVAFAAQFRVLLGPGGHGLGVAWVMAASGCGRSSCALARRNILNHKWLGCMCMFMYMYMYV